MKFITFRLCNNKSGIEKAIVNLDYITRIKKFYTTTTIAIEIFDKVQQYFIYFENTKEADAYFNFLLEKLHVIKLEENPDEY